MKKIVMTGLALAAFVGYASSPDAKKGACDSSSSGKSVAACKAKSAFPVIPTDPKRVWKMPFKLGLAGYTMNKRSLDETLEIMQAVDLHYLCVKSFHCSYDSTDAEIAAFKAKCAKYGVTPYALGPLYTDTNEKVREYFEFARRFGVKTVVGVPFYVDPNEKTEKGKKTRRASRKQLEYINTLVKEFDIKYAIHNHGPQVAEMFPDVEAGYEMVKDLDKRIGFCMDVGWEFGCGRDPAQTISKYGERIYDIHLKNFAVDVEGGRRLAKGQEHTFTTVPMPRGMVNYAQVFKALADVGYTGVCSLEYERDFTDNLEGVAESIGYARGVCDAIR